MMRLGMENHHPKCVRCGLPVVESRAHICIFKKIECKPVLEVIDGSEVCGEVDHTVKGSDHIFRPVLLEQDDGACLTLTLKDAQRIYDFLDEAIPFLEGKMTRDH